MRVTRWANTGIDVVAGMLCAIVAGWALPHVPSPGAAAAAVVVIAAIGWAGRRRAWSVTFLVAALLLQALGSV